MANSKTPEPIDTKFNVGDYVGDITLVLKLVAIASVEVYALAVKVRLFHGCLSAAVGLSLHIGEILFSRAL